jgi:hypothetical protein
MGVPTSEVGYTSATAGRGDHEVHKGHVVTLAQKYPNIANVFRRVFQLRYSPSWTVRSKSNLQSPATDIFQYNSPSFTDVPTISLFQGTLILMFLFLPRFYRFGQSHCSCSHYRNNAQVAAAPSTSATRTIQAAIYLQQLTVLIIQVLGI